MALFASIGDSLRFAAPVLRHRVRSWHRRADAKEQSTGLFHLNFRISACIKKEISPRGYLFFGDPLEIRTPDPLLKRQLLYRLS